MHFEHILTSFADSYRVRFLTKNGDSLKNAAKLRETTMIFGPSDLKIGYGVTRLQDSFLVPDFVSSTNDTM